MTHYVPLMMNLEERRCVIVGGGTVAERKVASLIEAGAEVTLISPTATNRLQGFHSEGRMDWIQRGYQAGDLAGAFLAYAATDRQGINDEVVLEAEGLGIPVNHAGDGSRGSFITPSIVRRGGLILAVSTSGAGPGASRALSREIMERYGDDYETYVDFLSFVRTAVKRRVQDRQMRARLYKSLAEMDILSSIREGRFQPWNEAEVIAWMDSYREE
ncbi:precorrin-2 dehydrogenase/sirohydrochlorin ferrochelatase [Fontibacillus phaseoli]|uniref:precorrin-2 dehydrogenase n=1 Tax=Fontibacillus phaseoli TaxID=1416533 RepID=A0A369BE66_9BACL|nr:bifunctional precorrin-2 dehydrogenase/sirohydrochlorin ferrochelatase [Fontibacillus phaseoli]RCX19852.1 precorrin-2 dehydrogenase/sirohydrochlorin ferrochelatase [Fontibacillus phaseoli]